MSYQLNLNKPEMFAIAEVLFKEAIQKSRVFLCDECEEYFLKEDKSGVESHGMAVCRYCAKNVIDEHKDSTTQMDYIEKQIKEVMEKISKTEHEFNDFIDGSRSGTNWDNEIESRKVRLVTLKRRLLDLKHKLND